MDRTAELLINDNVSLFIQVPVDFIGSVVRERATKVFNPEK